MNRNKATKKAGHGKGSSHTTSVEVHPHRSSKGKKTKRLFRSQIQWSQSHEVQLLLAFIRLAGIRAAVVSQRRTVGSRDETRDGREGRRRSRARSVGETRASGAGEVGVAEGRDRGRANLGDARHRRHGGHSQGRTSTGQLRHRRRSARGAERRNGRDRVRARQRRDARSSRQRRHYRSRGGGRSRS